MRQSHKRLGFFAAMAAVFASMGSNAPADKTGGIGTWVGNDPRSQSVIPPMKRSKKGKWTPARY